MTKPAKGIQEIMNTFKLGINGDLANLTSCFVLKAAVG